MIRRAEVEIKKRDQKVRNNKIKTRSIIIEVEERQRDEEEVLKRVRKRSGRGLGQRIWTFLQNAETIRRR